MGLGGLLTVGCMGPALHAPLARARRAAVPMQVQVRGWEPRAGLPFAGPGVGCGPSGHHIITGMLVPRKRRKTNEGRAPRVPRTQGAWCPQGKLFDGPKAGSRRLTWEGIREAAFKGGGGVGEDGRVHVGFCKAKQTRKSCLSEACFILTFPCNPESPPNQLKIIKY